jgi:hypothetical protein
VADEQRSALRRAHAFTGNGRLELRRSCRSDAELGTRDNGVSPVVSGHAMFDLGERRNISDASERVRFRFGLDRNA